MNKQQVSQELLGGLAQVLTEGTSTGDSLNSLTDITREMRKLFSRGTPSLTAYTAKSNVMSRVYLDQSVAADDICIPLLGTLNQLYCCYVMSALSLDSYVIGGRTVRDVIGSVASEGFNLEPYQLVNAVFGESKAAVMETVAALEANGAVDLEKDSQRFIVGRMIEIRLSAGGMLTTTSHATNSTISHVDKTDYKITSDPKIALKKNRATGKMEPETWSNPDTGVSGVYYEKEGGRRGELTPIREEAKQKYHDHKVSKEITNNNSTVTNNTETQSEHIQEFTAYIYVQLIPRLMTTDSSRLMLDIQYVPTLSERWRKYRAGEISFWKDFIFARDLVNKQHQALKNDRTGTIGQILTKSRGRLAQYFLGLMGLRDPSHNLASAITIISKDAFDRACKENHIDFNNVRMRNNYFNRTFTMMMVVVDTMYGKVDIYYNGVDYVGTYTFDMVNRVGAKGKDNFNLKEVMTAFSQGMSPRF